ncbi:MULTISPECIES: hypothetical protein [unclassified Burkholderia]|uniref:hypothetical protein n=1 Tax=unclassified Burkholderia TaxID=2613784 RepID=UPI00141E7BBE|nr:MULTISPECIES: hypothetical protein [unclassified Burkholderia]NIE83059.1 hypothetical protein [Burkholderia sp. Tr-860]NIF61827.1 hypothetical protein [Burkholderia sp. Cy-647]NIF96951.1 hypothetical protein [Burkholderia sp. Ax-1720]
MKRFLVCALVLGWSMVSVSEAQTTSVQDLHVNGDAQFDGTLSFGHPSGVTDAIQYAAPNGAARSVSSKLGDVVNVLDFPGCDPTGNADSTACIQNAVDSSAGKTLDISGTYRISAPITITKALKIRGAKGQAVLRLSTPNQNGIVLGDGTDATKGQLYYTSIDGLQIAPAEGVAASTSGAALLLRNVGFIDIGDLVIYGADSQGSKLFNGIVSEVASEYKIIRPRFSNLNGSGITTTGTDTQAHRNVDLFLIEPLFTGINGDCIYFGAFSEGQTVTLPVAYQNNAWFLHINSPTTMNGFNYFVTTPDIELDGTGQGIFVEQGSNLWVTGGWIGSNTAIGSMALKLSSAGSSHHFSNVEFSEVTATIDAPATSFTGSTFTGDNATQTVGVTVTDNATDFQFHGGRIRQYTQYGISLSANAFRPSITGVSFKNIGVQEVSGANNTNVAEVSSIQSDAPFSLAAVASLPLRYGRHFIQVNGSTPIVNMTVLAPGTNITVQAGSGGITFNGSPTLILKQNETSLNVPAFSIVQFTTDGNTWFETSRNF